MNRFSHIIFYVQDVAKTVDFYERAFGIKREFIDPTGHYAQLDVGSTALGFASFELAKQNLSKNFRALSPRELPGCEISFTAQNIDLSLAAALAAGAELIASPSPKPWGQTIAYVRDFNGILIELATEMAPLHPHSCCSCH